MKGSPPAAAPTLRARARHAARLTRPLTMAALPVVLTACNATPALPPAIQSKNASPATLTTTRGQVRIACAHLRAASTGPTPDASTQHLRAADGAASLVLLDDPKHPVTTAVVSGARSRGFDDHKQKMDAARAACSGQTPVDVSTPQAVNTIACALVVSMPTTPPTEKDAARSYAISTEFRVAEELVKATGADSSAAEGTRRARRGGGDERHTEAAYTSARSALVTACQQR